MNGNQPDALNLVTLNGIGRKVFFPFFDEIVNIRRMVTQVFVQCIIERADIRTLAFEAVKTEERIDFIDEIHE